MSSVGIASDSFNFFLGGDDSSGRTSSAGVCVPCTSSELVDEGMAGMADSSLGHTSEFKL